MPRSVIGSVLRFLRQVVIGPDPDPHAGFGQSFLDDLRFTLRFRRCRRVSPGWRGPTQDEANGIESNPIVARFGDTTLLVTEVESCQWIIRERDWYGWPDPPRYVFFALDGDRAIWAARDFDRWPTAWTPMPPL